MSIRIMHVLDNVGRGGMQNGVVNLIGRLDSSRFEHVVCSIRPLDHVDAHRFPEGMRVLCAADYGGYGRYQASALMRAIREARPDIVHSRNWSGIEAVLAARWAGGCAVVHSEHGVDSDTVISEPLRRIVFRRIAFESAHHVFCVSRQLRELHARRTHFPQRKISVIPNGVDTLRFFPDVKSRLAVREELGLGPDELCIGCVGNLTPVKDYPTVIRAIGELASHTRAFRLLVIGEGSELPKLRQMLQSDRVLQSRVQFLGLSNRVREFLNAMDIYVLSSITEGMSNSLLEAMATGLPVVATATGGNPEIVVDGESGILFPVGKWDGLAGALLQLYRQPAQREVFGLRARSRVLESFSLEGMIRNYDRLYQGFAPQHGAPKHVAAAI